MSYAIQIRLNGLFCRIMYNHTTKSPNCSCSLRFCLYEIMDFVYVIISLCGLMISAFENIMQGKRVILVFLQTWSQLTFVNHGFKFQIRFALVLKKMYFRNLVTCQTDAANKLLRRMRIIVSSDLKAPYDAQITSTRPYHSAILIRGKYREKQPLMPVL